MVTKMRPKNLKDSGIEWIGKVPRDWDWRRIKFLGKTIAGGTPATDDLRYWDGGTIPWLPSGAIQNRTIETNITEKFITELGLKESATKLIKSDAVLVALTGATCANVAYLTFPATANQSVVAINCNDLIFPKYLYYSLISNREQILINKTGGAQSGINEQDVRNIVTCLPPKRTQSVIASFLDNKTSTIDYAIEQKRKLVELLKEKRIAIINRAVTRGLGENVELVDSGVEWIGKIPKGWKMRKIAQSFNLIGSGSTPASGNEAFYEDGEINWIITGDLNDGTIHEASKKITKEAFASSSALKIYPRGTLLIAMYGATIGKVALIDIPACTNQACCALGDSPYFENKFVYYWFLINRKNIVDIYSYGSGQPNISQDTIKRLHIPVPSRDEQNKVIVFLDSKMDAIDQLISKVERSIELLAEYRISLISHVVTGKVEI